MRLMEKAHPLMASVAILIAVLTTLLILFYFYPPENKNAWEVLTHITGTLFNISFLAVKR